MNKHRRVVVVAGGAVTSSFLQANIDKQDIIIGADHGVVALLEAGILPKMAVGDFDTTGTEQFDEWTAMGIELISLSTIKDVTDTHAALELALTFHPSQILLLGALGGGRMDHTLANIGLLEWLAAHHIEGMMQDETNRMRLIMGPGKVELVNDDFTYVSILPISKQLDGVFTIGLTYPLNDQQLHRGDTLGISNAFVGDYATVKVSQGVGLIVESKDR